jgi:hypothetical protein
MLAAGRVAFGPLVGGLAERVERYRAGLQMDYTPESDPDAILHIKTKSYPDFVFEWHPATRKVYVLRLLRDASGKPEPGQRGELVAFEVPDHGAAQNAVLIWLRGYQTAANDRERVPFLRAEDY